MLNMDKNLFEWPGREMIQDIPSAWDQNKIHRGFACQSHRYCRRKGEVWYIASVDDG